MDITALLLRACAARTDPSPTQLVKPALFQIVTHFQRNTPLILSNLEHIVVMSFSSFVQGTDPLLMLSSCYKAETVAVLHAVLGLGFTETEL